MTNDIEQLQIDLLWLAKRQKVIEDAVIKIEDEVTKTADFLIARNKADDEWSEFITYQTLLRHVELHKHKKSDIYFKESLKGHWKENFEKFESLFQKINQLCGTKKKGNSKYNIYIP